MKAVVAAFNQEKALVGAFSVITNLRMELFGAGRGEAAGTCVPSRGFRVVRESSNIGVAASKLPLKPKLEQVKSRTVGF